MPGCRVPGCRVLRHCSPAALQCCSTAAQQRARSQQMPLAVCSLCLRAPGAWVPDARVCPKMCFGDWPRNAAFLKKKRNIMRSRNRSFYSSSSCMHPSRSEIDKRDKGYGHLQDERSNSLQTVAQFSFATVAQFSLSQNGVPFWLTPLSKDMCDTLPAPT